MTTRRHFLVRAVFTAALATVATGIAVHEAARTMEADTRDPRGGALRRRRHQRHHHAHRDQPDGKTDRLELRRREQGRRCLRTRHAGNHARQARRLHDRFLGDIAGVARAVLPRRQLALHRRRLRIPGDDRLDSVRARRQQGCALQRPEEHGRIFQDQAVALLVDRTADPARHGADGGGLRHQLRLGQHGERQ